jgi:type II secretory ATPase GspE/PulE/Tfp pilus assembly ATPase PilB-like protein
VIRVLDKSRSFWLEQLGFSAENLVIFKRLIEKPYGLILVTGPTGSGKTTTLYSALTHVNSLEVNIITLEAPVEYEMPLIRQCQINTRAGLTFVTGVRAILRHDPDIILVGEMRDLETVETTVRAALTGHLVFSTFHTNDAVGTIPRLLEMGVEPFLVASSLLAVVGQRLVRVICQHCKAEVTPDDELLTRVGSKAQTVQTFYKGKGCAACKQTGYRGRQGIFEMLQITPRIAQLISQKTEPGAMYKAALDEGMDNGLVKVSEKQQGGSVNQVLLENTSDRALFLMAGEVILGGKQDRVIGKDNALPWRMPADLRRFREGRGVSLRTIATASKIGVRFLEYIEADRHDQLPAPVYLRSFIQEYARAVGLDPRHTADAYMARLPRRL